MCREYSWVTGPKANLVEITVPAKLAICGLELAHLWPRGWNKSRIEGLLTGPRGPGICPGHVNIEAELP